MCCYIGIEDLAANALIEIMVKDNRRFVTYKELEEYGSEVIRILRKKKIKAVLILSRDNTIDMFRDYSDIFKEVANDSGFGVELKDENITTDILITKFRSYLSLDVFLAFIEKSSLAKLGISA